MYDTFACSRPPKWIKLYIYDRACIYTCVSVSLCCVRVCLHSGDFRDVGNAALFIANYHVSEFVRDRLIVDPIFLRRSQRCNVQSVFGVVGLKVMLNNNKATKRICLWQWCVFHESDSNFGYEVEVLRNQNAYLSIELAEHQAL